MLFAYVVDARMKECENDLEELKKATSEQDPTQGAENERS